MRNSLSTKKLITSIVVTILLIYFMAKSSSPKIIFIPFLICSISMAGKSIARIFNREKWEFVFGKIFILGFLLFFIGFLVVATYVSIRDKNYGLLAVSVPFWFVGFYLIKNKLLNKKGKKSDKSAVTFAIAVSTLLVAIAFLVGIYLFVLGFRESNLGIIFGGAIFTFGSLTFVLAAFTMQGCFDKVKIDVLGLYFGVVFVVIGMGFILLKFIESYSLIETIRSFGLWILIPLIMTLAGVIQIIKCFKKNGS